MVRNVTFVAVALALIASGAQAAGWGRTHWDGGAGMMRLAAADDGAVAPTVDITGFRSAEFGATERQVLSAIDKDFDVDGDKVVRQDHPVERTRALVIEVDNIFPDSGSAAIAYILGATSKKLMQVNLVWRALPGDIAGMQRIVANANLLRQHLLEKGRYAADSLAVNTPLPDNSMVVFRGADSKGRMVLLHLIPIPAPQAEDGKEAGLGGAELRLSYMANPAEPDVFKLPKKAF